MSKREKYNRAIRGTGWDYVRGILERQDFYRMSVNQVIFSLFESYATASVLANGNGSDFFWCS